MSDDRDDRVLRDAFERLRLGHLTFRRAEPEEVREIEAMRLDVLKIEATVPSPAGSRAVAAIQLRLMERAFYVLRLVHFANAPENHGWMNTFREWSLGPQFNAHYQKLKYTLSPEFRSFYEDHIRDYHEMMDEHPIHHPWHKKPGDRGLGVFMDTGRTEPRVVPASSRSGADGIDDAKGHAGRDRSFESPSGGAGGDSGPSVPNA